MKLGRFLGHQPTIAEQTFHLIDFFFKQLAKIRRYQSVGVRACESAIAHVRAVIQVRKGCEASWNCACEVRACGGIYGVRSQVRSHLKFYQ